MTERKRVLVIGAGPVGLVAALALVRRGIPVLVLEAEAALTIDLRAGSFHPPTVEMLDELGVADEMHRTGLRVPIWQFRDRLDGVVAEFDLGLLSDETRFPYRLHLEQHRLTPILLDRLRNEAGFEIRFGTRIATTGQDAEHAHAVTNAGERIEGLWLIGADGGRSVVRTDLGVDFAGFTWPERFLVASTDFDLGELGYADTAYVADPVLWSAVFRVPDDGPPGLWRIAYPTDPAVPEEEVLDDAAVQAVLNQILEEGRTYPLKYKSTYRVHQRVAASFRVGRILLAGDAAHINNPLGGFGLNGGIHDAVNFAEKLARVWHGEAGEDLLDLYDRQRRPTNMDHVQAQSIRNKRLLEQRDPAVRRQRNAEMRAIAGDPVRAKAHLMNTSMINSVRNAAAIT